jgi:uncharacterized YigZ family protein
VIRGAESDVRRVPAREGRGEVREKASRFFGFAACASSAAEAEAFLARLSREHHDATHVAFAWSIGRGPSASRRASDAGEPAGTAGRPILGALDGAGLDDAVAAVVRYYGGTKLGTGGLARAYRRAAEAAIAAAGTEVVYDVERLEVRCAYDRIGFVRRLIDPPAVRLVEERFEPDPALLLEVRRSRTDALVAVLEEGRVAVRRAASDPERRSPGAGV